MEESMREITVQVVMKLSSETFDAEVREIEATLLRAAKRKLIFKDESASVCVIMDRKVEEGE